MNSQVYNCNEQCQSWADGYDDVWENMIMDGGLLESINVSDDGRGVERRNQNYTNKMEMTTLRKPPPFDDANNT